MTLRPPVGDGSTPTWIKSSYSTNDGPSCVEVAWVKSSYSGSNNNDCVEVAATPATVLVRDSKNPGGPRLGLAPGAWVDFLAYAAR